MAVTYNTHSIAQHSIFAATRVASVGMTVQGTDYLVGFVMSTDAGLTELYYGASTFTKVAVARNMTMAVFDPNGATTGSVTITSSVNNGTTSALLCVVNFSGVRKAAPYSESSTSAPFFENTTLVLNLATTDNGLIAFGWYMEDNELNHTTAHVTHAPAASISTRENRVTDSTRVFQLLTHAGVASTFGSSHSRGTNNFYENIVTLSLNPAGVLSNAISQTIFLM